VKILTTEEGANKVDREWNEIYFKRKWLDSLSVHNINEEDFKKEALLLKKKFNTSPSNSDIIW
jgi:hypothetical protein